MKRGMQAMGLIRCRKVLRCVCLGLAVCLQGAAAAEPAENAPARPWVLIDTQALTLSIRSDSNKILARFGNISIGSGGTSSLHRKGDDTTPLGTFRVVWVDHHSRFHIFFGLNYPDVSAADRAYDAGLIGKTEYEAIFRAARGNQKPPQWTALGGDIGIHGVGRGDRDVQYSINWTNGCIALTDAQADKLSSWIRLGTRVVIR